MIELLQIKEIKMGKDGNFLRGCLPNIAASEDSLLFIQRINESGWQKVKKTKGKGGQTYRKTWAFSFSFLLEIYTLRRWTDCDALPRQRPFKPELQTKLFFFPNSDSLSESVNSWVQSAGANNGPCAEPTEPTPGLQWWSQSDPSGGVGRSQILFLFWLEERANSSVERVIALKLCVTTC